MISGFRSTSPTHLSAPSLEAAYLFAGLVLARMARAIFAPLNVGDVGR